jgi:tRNA modification GTPase
MLCTTDLIVAAATREGSGARAIVRLAGDGLDQVLAGLVDSDPLPRPGEPPRVVACQLAATGLGREWGNLPLAMLVWPGPGGPIGGPLAEVQLPACGPLVAAVIAEACRLGCRQARGGEFTLRAFLSGRMDLMQAEAVVSVTDARSPAELTLALDRLAGGAGHALTLVRGDLLDLLADIEAAIDFADEATPDSVPVGPHWQRVADRVDACDAAVAAVSQQLASRNAAAGDLPLVVLAGPPNIGKSSLFNRMVGHAAALVADETGTTRDWLEALVSDGTGPRYRLLDVAGMDDFQRRESMASAVSSAVSSAVMAEAVARARDAVARADVVLACRDAFAPAPPDADSRHIAVITRCDLAAERLAPHAIMTSSRTGEGVAELKAAILRAIDRLARDRSPATVRLAVGCDGARAALADARLAVADALSGGFVDESLVAIHLRRATDALADITGAAVDTDLLDRIFARHCIGK